MPNLYFISGLAADSRAFTKIQEFEGYKNIFLEWIPQKSQESLSEYASRLIQGHQINNDDILVGLSFGGLTAIEVAKHTPVKKVILLSSFLDKTALKPHLKFLLNLRLYNLMPNFKINRFDKNFVKAFGNISKEAKQGLINMMIDTDQRFIKWSLKQIRKSNFDHSFDIEIVNVLGTDDQLLQTWSLPKNNYYVEDGGHLMVYENADEVNSILKQLL